MSQSADVDESPESEPIMATLVAAVRTGSPFAAPTKGSAAVGGQRAAVAMDSMETGVMRETAQGGLFAAALMIPFAILSCWWFPFGGVLIAALGAGLGLFGLASPRPSWGAVLLSLHVVLFSVAFWRLI